MITIQSSLLFLSVLLSALIMGLLYGYACSVNPGLQKLGNAEYLAAMQSINKEIQNPVFFISFVGTMLILPAATWYSRSHASSMCFYLLLAATIVCFIGVIGITALGNIPLNNALSKFNIVQASAADLQQQREGFEVPWNKFHLVRTLFSVLTTMLTIAATLKK